MQWYAADLPRVEWLRGREDVQMSGREDAQEWDE